MFSIYVISHVLLPLTHLPPAVPWSEEPGRPHPRGREELGTTERLHFHFSLSCIGEGHGNLLRCSCLENPRDGGAWWAAVSGVEQSWTRLKRLSSSSSSSIRASQVLLVVKNPSANAGDVRDLGSIPGLGRSPGGGTGNPLQHSCLENPMDRQSLAGHPIGLQRIGHD